LRPQTYKVDGRVRFRLKRRLVERFWMLQILEFWQSFSLAVCKPAKISKLDMPKDATNHFESACKKVLELYKNFSK
jgi:hypothetical protein